MQRLATGLFVSAWCFLPTWSFAQDKNGPIPPRFQAFTKDGRLRLTRMLGSPEIQPAFTATTAFSADGKRALYVEDLTTVAEDQPAFRSRLLLWDVDAKGWPREFDIAGKSVTALALSPDASKALLAGQLLPEKEKRPKSFLSLWDLQAGKEIKTFITNERPIVAVALAPDAMSGLTGMFEDLSAWSLVTGKEIVSYGEKGKASATALAYLPDGKQFLSGSVGGVVRLWDVGKAKPVRIYHAKGDHEFTWCLSVSKDGARFVSADFQSSVSLWETATGKEIGTQRLQKRTVEEVLLAIALAGDGKTVLSASGKQNPAPDDFAGAKLIAWDGEANKTLWSHTVPYRGRVPIHVAGDKVQIGGGPNLFDIWSLKDGKHLESRGGHKGPVSALGVLADGDILSAGHEGVLMTWRKGHLARKDSVHAGAVTALAVSNDSKDWLTAGGDLLIRHGSLTMPKKHTGPITALAYSPDGAWACSGSGDRSVKTWNLKSGQEIATITGHSEGVNAVAISPDGRWIASGSDDATIRLWPIKNAKLDPDREAVTLEKHKKAVTCLAFLPDGKRLLSGSQDQTLMVWDVAKGSMDFMIPGHKNWITSILLLDAKTVLTCSDDLSVCAWDLENGKEIGRIDFGGVGDCPRCLAQIGPDRFVVGSSSWLIYEFQLLPAWKSKGGRGLSKE